jgi:hypothetical protein
MTLGAMPAAGLPPGGTASVSFTDNGDCTATVTYSWSGFKGRDLSAWYGVFWSSGGSADVWLLVKLDATESGTSSHTFDLTGGGAHTYAGGGRLYNGRQKLQSGSDVRSPESAVLSC